CLEANSLAIQLPSLLQSLKLRQLKRVQLLSTKHLGWCHHNLPLGKLEELGLPGILEGADGSNGLIHRRTSTVARLEVASLVSEAFLLILSKILVVWLAPIAVKVSRGGPGMALAATSLIIIGR